MGLQNRTHVSHNLYFRTGPGEGLWFGIKVANEKPNVPSARNFGPVPGTANGTYPEGPGEVSGMVTETRPDGADITEHVPRFSILVADDDRGTREALGEVLRNQGFHTVLAEDGSAAVEIVQVELIHLVLFDMHMPRMTGLEALNLLRHTIRRVLPAVLMTADATTELMRQAFLAQVYSVIPKPVNKNIVLHTLARALAQVYGKTAKPGSSPAPTQPTAPDSTGTGSQIPPGDTGRV